ncbi:hypothetical protein FXO38_04836 [Capsicum annuum]|nr:hypothetical protein FXO37_17799 [Capsicum annuum]KAF3675252.1 hypothetical protein FXO38_04836 [Capsicum annuum]
MATEQTPTPQQQQQQQQQLPLYGHELMSIPQTPSLAPAPPQPHPKEPKNDMSPPNIIFQQQNLPFSFSRQNPETVGSPVAAVGATAEPPKKNRGRPRKIVVDGNTCVTGATCSGNPSKKVCGRTSGSKKKQQEPKVLGSAELGSTTRTILVNTGERWGKLKSRRAWESRGDVDSTWETTASCIRETAREVLGVLRGRSGKHRGDWLSRPELRPWP